MVFWWNSFQRRSILWSYGGVGGQLKVDFDLIGVGVRMEDKNDVMDGSRERMMSEDDGVEK